MKRIPFKPELWFQNTAANETQQYFTNDVFTKYLIKCGNESENLSNIELIFPANEFIINKYSPSVFVNVSETPEMYHRFKENYVEKIDPKSNKWINNLFESSKTENLIFSGEQFVIGNHFSY